MSVSFKKESNVVQRKVVTSATQETWDGFAEWMEENGIRKLNEGLRNMMQTIVELESKEALHGR